MQDSGNMEDSARQVNSIRAAFLFHCWSCRRFRVKRGTVTVESRKNSLICRILIHEAESVHFCTATKPESCCSSGGSVSSISLLPVPVRDSAFDDGFNFPKLCRKK
jgi:hypothetical protein